MTPLAQRFYREALDFGIGKMSASQREMWDRAQDIHCFELSGVLEAAHGIAASMRARPDHVGKLAFLPAPNTWIEVNDEEGRCAILLSGTKSSNGKPFVASLTFFHVNDRGHVHAQDGGFLDLCGRIDQKGRPDFYGSSVREHMRERFMFQLYAQLALINTPRVIGRRQHMPHAGLQRKIAHAKGMVGKFPLHAWTEIKLEVTPPKLDRSATGDPHEAMMTGARALHFCRCHLRVRLGQLELVSAHWRGDPALGMKRSRYVLVPPRDGSQAGMHP
jgi:hypothetical protein